jgi:hypothetical protein
VLDRPTSSRLVEVAERAALRRVGALHAPSLADATRRDRLDLREADQATGARLVARNRAHEPGVELSLGHAVDTDHGHLVSVGCGSVSDDLALSRSIIVTRYYSTKQKFCQASQTKRILAKLANIRLNI